MKDDGQLYSGPMGLLVDYEDEVEWGISRSREQISKAEEMANELIPALLNIQDRTRPIRDHTDARRAESWITSLSISEVPPQATTAPGGTHTYLAHLSQPGRSTIRPMNTALEELYRAALRVKNKLIDAFLKTQSRLERGRRKTLVETLFMSGDEMEEFRVSVAERVAMLAAPNLSAVEKSHLEAELRATLFDIVGTPVWIIFGLLDQCVDVLSA